MTRKFRVYNISIDTHSPLVKFLKRHTNDQSSRQAAMLGLLPAICLLMLPLYALAAGPVKPAPEEENGNHPTNTSPITEVGNNGGSGQPGTHGQAPQKKDDKDTLGDQLDKLAELIKKVVEAVSADGGSSSTASNAAFATDTSNDFATASGTASPTAQVTTSFTAPALSDASGCLSAQSVFSSCAAAWTSTSGDVLAGVNNQFTKGDFATAGLKDQASCLCYTSNTVWATTVFDGWISQCDAYLQTASLPATTTVSSDLAAVTASAAKANIDSNLNLCSRAGDVKNTTPANTAPVLPSPINGAVRGKRITSQALLILTGLSGVALMLS